MILGIGTDILEISRIDKSLSRTPSLANRILSPVELLQFQSAKNKPLFLAKRFSAKEAVTKALGTGIGHGVSWQHIEICKNEYGRPEVSLSDGALKRAESIGIKSMHLSYSDEKDYIVAFVVAEG
ncbi:holo-ACP synthase [Neptuniibacter sp. SY11_33]|uniref:holo-ACP synthase n=1 Tax=Neptuniibacter sp. SY11_33 TaxID=3398215 RepID=UPI0039F4B0DE